DRAAGRSACDRAASAMAACAVMAALARFSDRASSISLWSAPGRAKAAAEVGGSLVRASLAGSGAGAGLAARGRGGLAEVGRPAFRGARAASGSGAAVGAVGRLGIRKAPGGRQDRSQGKPSPFRRSPSWHMTAPDMNAPNRKIAAVLVTAAATAG